MRIISEYIEENDKNYKNFTCKLDRNTSLVLTITDDNRLRLKMQDDISEIVDICAKISYNDVNALIKTLRTIYVEMGKTEENDNQGGIC